MKKSTVLGAVAAMVLGASSLAFAQTATTTPTEPSTSPRLTPPTGASHPPAATTPTTQQRAMRMTEADVKKTLADAGYTSVTNVKPDKDGYTAMAVKGGKKMRVDVDGNGKIEAAQ
jgi:hypothetical protein